MINWISSGMGMGMGMGIRVGYPQLTIYPRQLKNSGTQTDNIPDNRFFKTLNFIIVIRNKTKYV